MNDTTGMTIFGVAVVAMLAFLISTVSGCVQEQERLTTEKVRLEEQRRQYMNLFMIRLDNLNDSVAKEMIKNIDSMGKFLEMEREEKMEIIEKIKEEKGGDPEWMDSFKKE